MTEDEAAVRAVVEDWMAASKAGDTARILSLMTADALFMVPGRPPFGRAAFEKASAAQKGMVFDGSSRIEEVAILGDHAYLRSFLELRITPPGGTPIEKSGYTLTILRRETDGKWRLARDANLLV